LHSLEMIFFSSREKE